MQFFTSAIALILGTLHLSQTQSLFELCAEYPMVNGAGYISHPTDCDKFVHCHLDGKGTLFGEIQQCAFSTYWHPGLLTCVPVNETVCPNDRCYGLEDGTQFAGIGNCRGYWECYNGKARAFCCPQGQNWNDTMGCTDNIDDECLDRCFNDKPENQTCDKQAVVGNPSVYKQEVAGWGLMQMPCAPGTVFVEEECLCTDVVKPVSQKRTCKPEIYLPFTKNHFDQSGHNNYVANENVNIIDGVAKFNGVDSRLVMPRFTNIEHSTTVIIKIKYSSDHLASTDVQAIVSNSDCGNIPSILISEDALNTYFGVGTSDVSFVSTYVPQSDVPINETSSIKDLVYRFDGGVLIGSNGQNSDSVFASGYLKNVQCALHVGHARNLQPFKGEIDEITVYLCNPDTV